MTAEANVEPSRKRLKFRSYRPVDEKLAEKRLEPTQAVGLESSIAPLLAEKDNSTVDIDLNALAPRKADWDLKRDSAKKLEKLEKRTKRAMAEIIRAKIKSEQNLSSIAATQQDDGSDDSDG